MYDAEAARPSPHHMQEPVEGSTLEGGIVLGATIGQGAAGRVYAATSPAGEVAVKVFAAPPPLHLRDLAEALIQHPHPNLLRPLEQGRTPQGWPYLVMERLQGRSLEVLLAEGPVSREEAVSWGIGIAEGLGALHRLGWVHRDVKPHNVFILPCGTPKVLDFGLALRAGEVGGVGAFEGSWDYVAPEQAVGGAAHPSADVYGLGAMLYELVVGRVPFGDSPITAVLGHLHEAPRPPRLVDPTISPSLGAAISRALAKDPTRRFGTMEAFAAALASSVGDLEEAPQARSGPPWWAGGLLAALAAAATWFIC